MPGPFGIVRNRRCCRNRGKFAAAQRLIQDRIPDAAALEVRPCPIPVLHSIRVNERPSTQPRLLFVTRRQLRVTRCREPLIHPRSLCAVCPKARCSGRAARCLRSGVGADDAHSKRRGGAKEPPADGSCAAYASAASAWSSAASSCGIESIGQWPVASSRRRQGGAVMAWKRGSPAAISCRKSSQAMTTRS